MMPGMDMKKLKKLMKDVEKIDADRVIIEGKRRIVIENPDVMKINMMGKETFQIMGDSREEEMEETFSENDIALIKEKTGKSEEDVIKVLKENSGDIAKTIMDLKQSKESTFPWKKVKYLVFLDLMVLARPQPSTC